MRCENVPRGWVDGGFDWVEGLIKAVVVVALVATVLVGDGNRFVGGSGGVVARLRSLNLGAL